MRRNKLINDNWKFIKECANATEAAKATKALGETLNLPHTWNAKDGQDGGNDYYRGVCWYVKEFDCPKMSQGEEVWIEFGGVAMVADVYMNGELLGHHEGGYSTFRVNITEAIKEKNILVVSVDNTYTRKVYPQKADFTFYGGIYRDVNLIVVPKEHFDLGFHGSNGIKVTPVLSETEILEKGMGHATAKVTVEAWVENVTDGNTVRVTIGEDEVTDCFVKDASVKDGKVEVEFTIENVHLWDGLSDAYLYLAKAELLDTNTSTEVIDRVETKFGCRTFSFDKDNGFFLNGHSYPLCGAARHQDRWGVGNALTKEMHREDMEIMAEMGGNTIRLAHYQHDQYFYDLADEYGMIVWAEIPYITEHMPEGRENTISQMTELVVQNYNHPSIICWGLSNEITTTGGPNPDLVDNQRVLNDLCHKLDKTRPTTMANVFMLETDSEIIDIPDIRSYNLYYGWYVGDVGGNDEWFDDFREKHPNTIIGLSEFGADANPKYQSAKPEKGDYTESYQAVYHEHMLKMWNERPYIWAMHVWNMFDFAADGREEGGKPGVNQKGLVTMDRKIKKDAFYIYKAYLSKEPFVHICGSRYVDRVEESTEIKVYSNMRSVTLFVDGKEFAVKEGDKVFNFLVPITGEHHIEARSGSCSHVTHIRKVDKPNEEYLSDGSKVTNWFDKEELEVREGYYSIQDSMEDIHKSPEAMTVLTPIMEKAAEAYGDVAKNVKIPESMRKMMDKMSLESTLKQMGKTVTPEMVVELNKVLVQIKK